MNPLHFAGLLAATFFALQGSSADNFDWPQWQGPDRIAHSKETGLLKEWPKDGPPLAWKVKNLGGGDSTPSVAAGRIYGMSHRGADEIVWALSEKDGKEAWAVRIAPGPLDDVPAMFSLLSGGVDGRRRAPGSAATTWPVP